MRSSRKTRNRIIALAILVIFVATIVYTNNPSAMFSGTGFTTLSGGTAISTSTGSIIIHTIKIETCTEVTSDNDNDGLCNSYETDTGRDVNGLSTYYSPTSTGTDPNNQDTDGDGVIDGADAFPLDKGASLDFDGDRLPNEVHSGWTASLFGVTSLTYSETSFKTNLIEDEDDDGDFISDIYETVIFPPIDTSTDITSTIDKYPSGENHLGDYDTDFDGDGNPNRIDLDSDDDCILDTMEMFRAFTSSSIDVDSDGRPNFLDTDSDGDGITDRIEAGTTPLTQALFDAYNFNFNNPDPEDKIFVTAQTNQDYPMLVLGNCPFDPVNTDKTFTNRDDIPDYLDLDSDGDGIPDEVEALLNNGIPVDTDGNGTYDFLDTDSDGDGIDDAIEGTDDIDGDGIPNYRDLDSDGDLLLDSFEYTNAVYAWNSNDTDNDLLADGYEYTFGGCTGKPSGATTDGDTDNDGLKDNEEEELWTNCKEADTDGDGIDDKDEVTAGTDPLTACSPGPIAIIADPYMFDDKDVTLSSRGSMPKGYNIIFDASESTGYDSTQATALVWTIPDGVTATSSDEIGKFIFSEAGDYEIILNLIPTGTELTSAYEDSTKIGPNYAGGVTVDADTCSAEEKILLTIDDAEDFSPVKSMEVSISLADPADQTKFTESGVEAYPTGQNLILKGEVEGSEFATEIVGFSLSLYNASETINKNKEDDELHKIPDDNGELVDSQEHTIVAPKEGTYNLKYEVTMEIEGGSIVTQITEYQIEINNGLNPVLKSPEDGGIITLGKRVIFEDDSVTFSEKIKDWTLDVGDRATPWGYLKIPTTQFVCFSAAPGSTNFCDKDIIKQSNEIDSPCGCDADEGIYPLAKLNITNLPDRTYFHTYKTVNDCGEDYICQITLSLKSDTYNSEKSIELKFAKNDVCSANPDADICKSAVGVEDLCVKWPSLPQCVTGVNITSNDTYVDPFEGGTGKQNQLTDNPPNNDGKADPLDDLGGDDDEGSSLTTILIVLMLLSAIGGLGFYFWKKGMFDSLKSKPPSEDTFEATPETAKSEPEEKPEEKPEENSDVKDYITKAKDAGETNDQMKEGLKAAGWPDSEINKYL